MENGDEINGNASQRRPRSQEQANMVDRFQRPVKGSNWRQIWRLEAAREASVPELELDGAASKLLEKRNNKAWRHGDGREK